jgi:hypothetical protein
MYMADRVSAVPGGECVKKIGRQPQSIVKILLSNISNEHMAVLCKDSAIICSWHTLVKQTKAKRSIRNGEFHNAEDTGFVIGNIMTQVVVIESKKKASQRLSIFLIMSGPAMLERLSIFVRQLSRLKSCHVQELILQGIYHVTFAGGKLSLKWLSHS